MWPRKWRELTGQLETAPMERELMELPGPELMELLALGPPKREPQRPGQLMVLGRELPILELLPL